MLCELCLDAAPDGAVRVKKLYDGTELGALTLARAARTGGSALPCWKPIRR